MKILVSGSHGLVGKALSKSLTNDGHEVVRLVRHTPIVGAPEIWWDPGEGRIDAERLEGHEVVVHLAGESIASVVGRAKRNEFSRVASKGRCS